MLVPKIIDIRSKLKAPEFRNPNFPRIPKRLLSGVRGVVLHCTADRDRTGEDIYKIAKYDIKAPNHISKKGCPSITYHWYSEFVDGKFRIYRCLDYEVLTWHAGNHNRKWVALVVDYDAVSEIPDDKYWGVINGLAMMLIELDKPRPEDSLTFHRRLKGTGWRTEQKKINGEMQEVRVYRKSCPGWNWKFTKIVADVSRRKVQISKSIQFSLSALGYPCGTIDGIIGTRTKTAVGKFQEDFDLQVTNIPDYTTQILLQEELVKLKTGNISWLDT